MFKESKRPLLFNYWWEQWEWKREESQPRKAIKNFIIFSAIFFLVQVKHNNNIKIMQPEPKKSERWEKNCMHREFFSIILRGGGGEKMKCWWEVNEEDKSAISCISKHKRTQLRSNNRAWWKKAFQLSSCRVKFLS